MSTDIKKVASLVNHFDGLASPPLVLVEGDSSPLKDIQDKVDSQTEEGLEEDKLHKIIQGVVPVEQEEGEKGEEGEGVDKVVEESERVVEKPEEGSTPLAKLLSALPALSALERTAITSTLSLLPTYPSSLPLSDKWTLYFSDTAKKVTNPNGNNSGNSAADAYTDLQTELFSVDDVAGLCGSLKAYKRLARSKRARDGDMHTMGLAGMVSLSFSPPLSSPLPSPFLSATKWIRWIF